MFPDGCEVGEVGGDVCIENKGPVTRRSYLTMRDSSKRPNAGMARTNVAIRISIPPKTNSVESREYADEEVANPNETI